MMQFKRHVSLLSIFLHSYMWQRHRMDKI